MGRGGGSRGGGSSRSSSSSSRSSSSRSSSSRGSSRSSFSRGSTSSNRGSTVRSGGSSSKGRAGGFSGGSSSSGGGFSGGSSGGYSGGHRPGGPPRPYGFFGYRRPRRSRTVYINNGVSRSGGSGCGSFLVIIVTVIILMMAFRMMQNGGFTSINSTDITKSTIVRDPLEKGNVNETEYYSDEAGWIKNETTLLAGLKNFYSKTGVQPYLYITDSINGNNYPTESQLEDFANQLYEELFTDEAHLLLVFFEYEPYEYSFACITGTQAKTVIDREAVDILLDYLDRYYYSDNLSDEEYFSKSFNDAAERIMEVYRSPWIPVLVAIAAIIVVILLFKWWKRAKEQKNKENEMNAKILNTPLEQFGDTEAEELGKKYED